MKYLKKFEQFDIDKSISISSEIKDDVIDICLELEDMGFIITKTFIEYMIRIVIERPSPQDSQLFDLEDPNWEPIFTPFTYSDISDCVERLIDYLKLYDFEYIIYINGNNINKLPSESEEISMYFSIDFLKIRHKF
jgi:hypothetical protein